MSDASTEPQNLSETQNLSDLPAADFSEAARRMGQARTEAKRLAGHRNGRLGGRPEGYVVSPETRRKISQTKRRQAKMKKVEDE